MKIVEEQNQNIDLQNQAESEMDVAESNLSQDAMENENVVVHKSETEDIIAETLAEECLVEEESVEKDLSEENPEEQVSEEETENLTSETEKTSQDGETGEKKKSKSSKSSKSDKDDKEKMAILESILFAMGDSVEVSRLAQVIEETPRKTRNLLLELQKKYKRDKRGIDIIALDDCFQMCTKPEMYEYLVKIAKVPRKYTLSDTVLETLSIVAYKQPVTRIEIEKIRGVSCDHAVNRLLEFDLIKEVGRLDAPGRPLLFGTTEQFLRSFGVKNLEELPQLNQDRVEEFREEAEQEVQLKLDI